MSERTNWRTIQFLLENMVFLLIGLQTRWILDALGTSGPRLVLALSGVRSCDAGGLAVIDGAARRAWRRGGWLRLVEVPAPVLAAYMAAGQQPVVYPDTDAAIAAR